jgi:hypothetical protein
MPKMIDPCPVEDRFQSKTGTTQSNSKVVVLASPATVIFVESIYALKVSSGD